MTGLEAFIAAASEPFIKAIVTTVTTGGIKFVGKEGSNLGSKLLDGAGNLTIFFITVYFSKDEI